VLLAHQLPLVLLSLLMLLALIGGIFLGRSEGANPEKFMFLGLPALVGGFLVVFLLTLASMVYVPAALVRFIETDRVASAFDVTSNLDFIRSHLPAFLTGLIAIVLAAFIAQFGLLIFCIGWFPATFWSASVMGYVVGELARLADGSRPREQSTG
jgi:Protein of unknown function (DUF4013)